MRGQSSAHHLAAGQSGIWSIASRMVSNGFRNLENQDFPTFAAVLPSQWHRLETQLRPLFPGYMAPGFNRRAIKQINNTRGVARLESLPRLTLCRQQ